MGVYLVESHGNVNDHRVVALENILRRIPMIGFSIIVDRIYLDLFFLFCQNLLQMIKLVHILLKLVAFLLKNHFLFGQLAILLFPISFLFHFLDSLELLHDFVFFPFDQHSLLGDVSFLLGEFPKEGSKRFLVLQNLFARSVVLTLKDCSFPWDWRRILWDLMLSHSLGLLNCLEFTGGPHPFWLVLEHFIKIVD